MRKIAEKFQLAKAKAYNYIACKQCGVEVESGDHLVEVLGTIIIAVVILIFFRAQITALFKNMISNTSTKVNNLFTDVA